jgi:hypothetical protein
LEPSHSDFLSQASAQEASHSIPPQGDPHFYTQTLNFQLFNQRIDDHSSTIINSMPKQTENQMGIFRSVISTFIEQELFWTSTFDDLNLELARRALNKEGILMLSQNCFFQNLINDSLVNVFDVGPQIMIFQYQNNLLAFAQNEQQEFLPEGTEIGLVMNHFRTNQLVGKPNYPQFLILNDFVNYGYKPSSKQFFIQLMQSLVDTNRSSFQNFAQTLELARSSLDFSRLQEMFEEKIKMFIDKSVFDSTGCLQSTVNESVEVSMENLLAQLSMFSEKLAVKIDEGVQYLFSINSSDEISASKNSLLEIYGTIERLVSICNEGFSTEAMNLQLQTQSLIECDRKTSRLVGTIDDLAELLPAELKMIKQFFVDFVEKGRETFLSQVQRSNSLNYEKIKIGIEELFRDLLLSLNDKVAKPDQSNFNFDTLKDYLESLLNYLFERMLNFENKLQLLNEEILKSKEEVEKVNINDLTRLNDSLRECNQIFDRSNQSLVERVQYIYDRNGEMLIQEVHRLNKVLMDDVVQKLLGQEAENQILISI